jgi:hypothetical protein
MVAAIVETYGATLCRIDDMPTPEWSGRGTGRQSELRHCHVAADRLRGMHQRWDKFAADLRGTVSSSLCGYVDRGYHIA